MRPAPTRRRKVGDVHAMHRMPQSVLSGPKCRSRIVCVVSASSLSSTASLLAVRARATICLALMDGRAWTASELARHAGISAPTTSQHLTALIDGGLLREARQGRHRYVSLAGPEIAQLIEDLAGPPEAPKGLGQIRIAARLAAGRTCYDHLAGDLGVSIHDALVARGLLSDAGVTDAGRSWFVDLLGWQCLQRTGSRPLVRPCLDWSRRTHHLGGALGAELCAHMFENAWIRRPHNDRAVVPTSSGAAQLHNLLGMPFDEADGPGVDKPR